MKFSALLALASSVLHAEADPTTAASWKVASDLSCDGQQLQYTACNSGSCESGCEPVDCKMGDWQKWGACTCEGLRDRSRPIEVHNNECGKPCSASTLMTDVCPTHCLENATNCELGDWEEWAACQPDSYQTFRNRRVVTPAKRGGTSCMGDVKETKDCPGPKQPDDRDCAWSHWSAWSACTCTCDGGQKTRDRHVTQAPRGNGARCETETKSQVAPCNTQSCSVEPCRDGSWQTWQPWEACTATCGGGTTWRRRNRESEADHCGVPAEGKDAESKPCNTQSCQKVDCEVSDWSSWSACSCSCEGVQRRNRQISTYGRGDGEWCLGALKQIQGCNNFTDTPNCAPATEKAVDCGLAEWGAWSTCTAKCGGGQHQRSRIVETPPKNGGAPCDAHLEVTASCNTQPCKTVDAVSCEYMQWSDWGACDKCGGQKKRSRGIKTMPEDGGAECTFLASEETDDCDRVCHAPHFCEWGEWAHYGACSSSCGAGVIKRKRTLKATTTKPSEVSHQAPVAAAKQLYETVAVNGGSYSLQEVLVSFACGGFVTFACAFAALRVVRHQQTRGTFESLVGQDLDSIE